VKWNQRWAWCCGGGGGVPEADPNLAQWSATDRMREAKETGAEFSFDFKRVMPALVQCA
jgi:Fe-S oxidoreductase